MTVNNVGPSRYKIQGTVYIVNLRGNAGFSLILEDSELGGPRNTVLWPAKLVQSGKSYA